MDRVRIAWMTHDGNRVNIEGVFVKIKFRIGSRIAEPFDKPSVDWLTAKQCGKEINTFS